MKTIKIITCVCVSALGLLTFSCNKSEPLPKEYNENTLELIVEKVTDKEMTEADYAQIIDWWLLSQQEFADAFNKCIDESESEDDFRVKAEKFNDEWERKWPNIHKIHLLLIMAKPDEIGEDNMARLKKADEEYKTRTDKFAEKLKTKLGIDIYTQQSEATDSIAV